MTAVRSRFLIVAAAALAVAGCAGPSTGGDRSATPAATTPAAVATTCKDGLLPQVSLPARTSSGRGAVAALLKSREKRFTIGVSGDALLWGYSDPAKQGELSGYDVELARAVAKNLGFTDSQVELRVLPLSGRIAALNADATSGGVDLVAERFSMNCDRWQGTGSATAAINFSTPYYTAYQKLLIRTDLQRVTSLKTLAGRPVCAVTGSTSLQYLQSQKIPNIVQAADSGQCLVKFQEGEAAAISADETTLAGFAKQDHFAKVIDTDIGPPQYYGLGVAPGNPKLTQYVNGALRSLQAHGELNRLYNTYMKPHVAPGSSPALLPKTTGSRDLGKLQRKP